MTVSLQKKILRGIPRESLLRSIPFTIYTDELFLVTENFDVRFYSYADDKQIIDNLEGDIVTIRILLMAMKVWMFKRNLVLNVS